MRPSRAQIERLAEALVQHLVEARAVELRVAPAEAAAAFAAVLTRNFEEEAAIERAVGRRAQRELLAMQPGDVTATYADIETARRDLGFAPTTPIAAGIPRFVAWYREYHGVG